MYCIYFIVKKTSGHVVYFLFENIYILKIIYIDDEFSQQFQVGSSGRLYWSIYILKFRLISKYRYT